MFRIFIRFSNNPVKVPINYLSRACGIILDTALPHSGQPFNHRDTKAQRKLFLHFGQSLRGFREPLNRMFLLPVPYFSHFPLGPFSRFPLSTPAKRTSPFWTPACLILDTLVQEASQSRAVLPKPPQEPVSAKLACLKLRTLPPLRYFGVSLNTTIFCFTTILDNLDTLVQNALRCSTLAPREAFRAIPSGTDGTTTKS